MSHEAQVVVEIAHDSVNAETLLTSLRCEFGMYTAGDCEVERKENFTVAPDFEGGACLAMSSAVQIDRPWGGGVILSHVNSCSK